MAKKTLSAPAEDCLLRVHRLSERSEPVTTSGLARQLGVRDSTVTVMVQKLARRKLLTYKPRKEISLTKAGTEVAQKLIRRHRLIETFLCEHLGYSWAEVHDEAERIEHAVSEKFVEAIDKKLGRPEFDPHGDPIPDRNGSETPRELCALSAMSFGESGLVAQVFERDSHSLVYLAELELKPGATIQVLDAPPADDLLHLSVNGHTRVIGRALASGVMIMRDPRSVST